MGAIVSGRLTVIGLGPGDARYLTPEANEALAAAEQGGMAVELDGKTLTCRRMYDVVARAAVFSADPSPREVLNKLSRVPLFGHLFG